MKKSELTKLKNSFQKQRDELEKAERKALEAAAKQIETEERERITGKLAAAGVKGAKVTIEVNYDEFEPDYAWDELLYDTYVSIVHKGEYYNSVDDLLANLKDEAELAEENAKYEREMRIAQAVNADPEFKALTEQRNKLMKKLQTKFKKEIK